jgi:tRNA pseudouridine55 synthase
VICGFLVIDKPAGLTSHDVVATIRATTGVRKVGHTGTLDPFARGVLPLALGRATRLIQYLDEDLKIYDATILLGSSMDTGDPTGEVIAEAPVPPIEKARLEEIFESMRGTRMQAPPRYSAVKIKGRRLYSYARAGEEVEIPERPVRIDKVELMEVDSPRLRVRIQCGRGTYARVLAEDIAHALGTVGHLEALRRTRSGLFEESQALSLESFSEMVAGNEDWKRSLRPARGEERVPWKSRDQVIEGLRAHILPPGRALAHLPEVQIPESAVAQLLRSGQLRGVEIDLPTDAIFKACHQGQMLALMRLEASGPRVLRLLASPD